MNPDHRSYAAQRDSGFVDLSGVASSTDNPYDALIQASNNDAVRTCLAFSILVPPFRPPYDFLNK